MDFDRHLFRDIVRSSKLKGQALTIVEHSESYEGRGPTMFARIGVMRALNRHVERVYGPSRKDSQWGRRKLKRDE